MRWCATRTSVRSYELQRTYLAHQRLHTLFGLSTIPTRRCAGAGDGLLAAAAPSAGRGRAHAARTRAVARAWARRGLAARAVPRRHAPPATAASCSRSGASDAGPAGRPRLSAGRRWRHRDLHARSGGRPCRGSRAERLRPDPRRRPAAAGRGGPPRARGPCHRRPHQQHLRLVPSFEETYRHPVVLAAAAAVVARVEPDIAHVQHLTCLSIDLVATSGAGVPVVLTLHDYWMLCHRGQLVDRDGRAATGPVDGECCALRSCGRASAAVRIAARSLLRTLPGASAAIHAASRMVNRLARGGRHRHHESAFRRTCAMSSRERIRPRAIPDVAGRFAACGMAHHDVRRWDLGIQFTPLNRTVRDSISPLRVGFVGSFIPTKAPHLLIEAARMLPSGSVTVDLAGRSPATTATTRIEQSWRRCF